MATLQKIRQRGVLLTVVIGLALLAFIIGGIDFNSLSGNSRTTVAEVDGNDIKIQDYENLLDEMTTFYKFEMGVSSLDEQTTTQIRNTVWTMWVNEQLIAEQCEKLGLVVSDDELADNLSAINPHPMLAQVRMFYNPQTGRFDPSLVVEFAGLIASNQATPDLYKYWSYVQRNIRNQILQDKYYALVGASFNFNDIDVKQAYNDKQTYSLDYVSIPYATVADSAVSVSESDIKTLYKNQKKQLARQQESRNVGILAFNIEPSEDDFNNAKAWVDKVWAEFSAAENFVEVCNYNSDVAYDDIAKSRKDIDPDMADFAFSAKKGESLAPKLYTGNVYKMAKIVETGIMAPDSVNARHILVMEDTPERTKIVADSLLSVINKGGNFEVLAKQYSKAGTAQNGGELGWFKDGDIDKDFSKACFDAKTGKAFIYEMGQITHIVEVTEKTKPVEKVKICVLQREVEPSSKTYALLFNEANQFAAKCNNSTTFADIARTLNGVFYRQYDITADNNTFANIKDSRQIVRWAFNASEGDVADKVFECGNQYVLACLNKINKEGEPSLDEVSDNLRRQVLNDKKAEKLIAENTEKLAGSNDLSKLGQVKNVASVAPSARFIQGVGVEPELLGSLSKLAADGNVALFEGTSNVIAAKAAVVNPQPETYDAMIIRMELQRSRPYSQMVTQSLKSAAKIKDNRINFY